MKFFLRSTSFLLPKSNSWNELEKNHKLIFSTYGDIFSSSKSNEKFGCEIFVIFLNDLIDYFNVKKTSQKKELLKCKKIIEVLEKKLKSNAGTNFIISFSTYYYFNYLNESKSFSYIKKIKFYFTQQLYALSKKYSNFFVLDIDDLFAQYGYDKCYDQKNYFTLRCRLSTLGIEILSKCLNNLILKIYKTNKKVLLLDCDETLWGGIVGEDGLKNLKLGGDGIGLAYVEFQKAIKKIKETGIIIALLSKNNESDVKQVLEKHQFMILKNKDIAAFKVNWKEKSFNIRQLSKELFLGLDSFVFWDDNPIERQKVRIQLKGVDVIEPDKDVTNWPKQLLEYKGFSKFYISKEDADKTKQYKKRTIFLDNKSSAKNEIDYLKKINIKPKLIKLNNSNLVRSEQMCQKTNQFNFNTKRYKMNDLTYLNKKNFLFLVDLTDDYGKHGIVGQFILKKYNNILLVDLFLMSCRIMGRYLENWMLSEIKKIATKEKIKEIIFEFVPTKKNITIIKNYIKINKFEKMNSKNLKKLLNSKKQKSILNSSAEYYSFNPKKKIINLEVYK